MYNFVALKTSDLRNVGKNILPGTVEGGVISAEEEVHSLWKRTWFPVNNMVQPIKKLDIRRARISRQRTEREVLIWMPETFCRASCHKLSLGDKTWSSFTLSFFVVCSKIIREIISQRLELTRLTSRAVVMAWKTVWCLYEEGQHVQDEIEPSDSEEHMWF